MYFDYAYFLVIVCAALSLVIKPEHEEQRDFHDNKKTKEHSDYCIKTGIVTACMSLYS